MTESSAPRPEREAGNRGTRPFTRRGSIVFVSGLLLIVVLFALFTIYMVTRTAEDPEIQQGIEESRQEFEAQPPADTLGG